VIWKKSCFQGSTGKLARLQKSELENEGTTGVIEYSVTSLTFQDMSDPEGVEGLEVLQILESKVAKNKYIFLKN
jgi:hypothetical protein